MLNIFIGLIGFYLILVTIYVLKNRHIWDNILGMNLFASLISIGITLYAASTDNNMFLDIAIASNLLGFIGTVFTAIYIFRKGDIK